MRVEPAQWGKGTTSIGMRTLQALGSKKVDRCKAVYQILVALCEAGTRIHVETGLASYPFMLLESVACPVEARDSREYSLTFVEYLTVETSTSTVSKRVDTAEKRAQKEVAKGKAPEGIELAPIEARRQSLVVQISDVQTQNNE